MTTTHTPLASAASRHERPVATVVAGRDEAAGAVRAVSLRRLRWAVRGVLLLGVSASVAANVLHANPNPISQTIAAWPPLALLLTVELIARIPVHRRCLAAVRLGATTGIASIAAWVSYWHMASVVARYGETGATPYLMPFSVDGLVIVASVCLVELAGRIRTAEQPQTPAPASPPADQEDWVITDAAPVARPGPALAPMPADAFARLNGATVHSGVIHSGVIHSGAAR